MFIFLGLDSAALQLLSHICIWMFSIFSFEFFYLEKLSGWQIEEFISKVSLVIILPEMILANSGSPEIALSYF